VFGVGGWGGEVCQGKEKAVSGGFEVRHCVWWGRGRGVGGVGREVCVLRERLRSP
jgi:hypothetical protein